MTFGEILRASPPVRRRNNGTLYELTTAQKKKCDELIRKECFLHRDGNCLYLEDKEGPSPCAHTGTETACISKIRKDQVHVRRWYPFMSGADGFRMRFYRSIGSWRVRSFRTATMRLVQTAGQNTGRRTIT